MALNFELFDINRRVKEDPRGLLAECDATLNYRLAMAAAAIATAAPKKHIVMLSGPSGSGKTTTAGKLSLALSHIGITSYVVSMDDYFKDFDPETHPRDERGNIDFESPLCLDIPLLTEHFAALSAGEEITLPQFDFTKQKRSEKPGRPIRLREHDVAVFEGIHALNPSMLAGDFGATRVYVSARTGIKRDGELFFKGTWIRLVRRIIRDAKFRGWDAAKTMDIWHGVRRGEKKYISPYKELADIIIDTATPCDMPVLLNNAAPLFSSIPESVERYGELCVLRDTLNEIKGIDESLVSVKSLLREFIGGGIL